MTLKYVEKICSRGRDYYYFRRGNSRIRLPDPTDAEFSILYQKLLLDKQKPGAIPGTMAALVIAYKLSPEYVESYEHYLRLISEDHGTKLVDVLAHHNVIKIRNELSATPGKADNYVKTLSVLMRHAMQLGMREGNPCHGVSRLCKGEYQPWPPHIWEAAIQKATPMFRLALFTLRYSGQRNSDACRMAHNRIVDNMVEVKQQKTGKMVWVPLHRIWKAEIAKLPVRAPTILYNRLGHPFTPDSLQERWRRLREIIGAGDYHLHGLRKNACNALAEVGCSEHEIRSITGQSLVMVQHYTKMANQKVLAKRAIRRWENKDEGKRR